MVNGRDRERAELQPLGEQREAPACQAANDSARANLLLDELQRSRAKASARREPSPGAVYEAYFSGLLDKMADASRPVMERKSA